MLLLRGNTDLLRVVTGSAADIRPHISVVQIDAGTPPVVQPVPDFGALAAISTATTTTQVDATGLTAGHCYAVKDGSWFNAHATQLSTFKAEVFDGTRTSPKWNGTLLAGEMVVLDEVGVWTLYDANGNVKAATFPAATQTEMEAATSNTVSVTPANLNWHPGVPKAWAKHAVSAGVPQMTATWNVTSVTDSAVCRVAPVIATDFSSANYVILYGFECNTTTYSATTTALIQTVRNATQAAGGFTMDLVEIDIGQTTDPASWHWVAFGDQ